MGLLLLHLRPVDFIVASSTEFYIFNTPLFNTTDEDELESSSIIGFGVVGDTIFESKIKFAGLVLFKIDFRPLNF